MKVKQSETIRARVWELLETHDEVTSAEVIKTLLASKSAANSILAEMHDEGLLEKRYEGNCVIYFKKPPCVLAEIWGYKPPVIVSVGRHIAGACGRQS
jgi:hypothetical protein